MIFIRILNSNSNKNYIASMSFVNLMNCMRKISISSTIVWKRTLITFGTLKKTIVADDNRGLPKMVADSS